MSETSTQAPLDTIRNKAVFAKLWEQQGPKGSFVNVEFGRIYRHKETGEFHESKYLSQSDIEKLIPLMPQVHARVLHHNDQFRRQARIQAREQAAPEQAQGLIGQRDNVMAAAKPPAPAQGPHKGHDHGPEM